MAEQPSGSATRRVLQAAARIFRPTRSPGHVALLHDDDGDELVVFEALPDIRRRSEPQPSARTEQQEAASAASHSQGNVPSGVERPPSRAPSEPSLSSGNFLPHGATRRIGKCCKSKKSRCYLLVGLGCAVAVAILGLLITLSLRSNPTPVTPSWLSWRNRTDDNGLPRLLLWNPDHPAFNTTWCKISGSPDPEACEITTNRHQLTRSDAIVFYPENLDINDAPLQRSEGQLWVFWSRQRRPPLGKGTIDSPSLSLPVVAHMFNWTMAKREDADVVIPHETFRCQESVDKPQARAIDRKDKAVSLPPKRDVAWVLDRCEERRYMVEIENSPRGKDKSAQAGDTVGLRMIPLCGATLCETPIECVSHIAKHYHFIVVALLPECFQTVYEVIYEAFKYDLVPVVLMPPNGTLNVPKRSVVTSTKLQGKGQLAKYLRSLLDNPDKYRSFLAWKQHCSVIPTGDELCALCVAMWEIPMRQRPHADVLEWWTRFKSCTIGPLYGLDSAFVQEF
ncbi:hypothetical protein V5799_030937 [Amblyomma americanum]|uniref:Fucosyltransferase n=1 Tax=Amblyomma americanum TaxID=6943 RepID=A0AAQ4EMB7_AMBAM